MSGTLMDNMCPVCNTYPCMCSMLENRGYVIVGTEAFNKAARVWAENNGWREIDNG